MIFSVERLKLADRGACVGITLAMFFCLVHPKIKSGTLSKVYLCHHMGIKNIRVFLKKNSPRRHVEGEPAQFRRRMLPR